MAEIHSNIELITRDGSKTYAKAITEAPSSILQVGDRWHILHQLFEAIKKTIHSVIPMNWKPTQKEISTPEHQMKETSHRKEEIRRKQSEEKR